MKAVVWLRLAPPGVYWTHNDSGDGPFIYAVDEKGGSRGVCGEWQGLSPAIGKTLPAGPGPATEQTISLYRRHWRQ